MTSRLLGAAPRAGPAAALVVMLLAQAVLSLAALALPAMAAAVARSTGIDAAWVGYYSAAVTLGAASAAILAAPLVVRHGPVRSSQATLLAAGAGALLLLHGLARGRRHPLVTDNPFRRRVVASACKRATLPAPLFPRPDAATSMLRTGADDGTGEPPGRLTCICFSHHLRLECAVAITRTGLSAADLRREAARTRDARRRGGCWRSRWFRRPAPARGASALRHEPSSARDWRTATAPWDRGPVRPVAVPSRSGAFRRRGSRRGRWVDAVPVPAGTALGALAPHLPARPHRAAFRGAAARAHGGKLRAGSLPALSVRSRPPRATRRRRRRSKKLRRPAEGGPATRARASDRGLVPDEARVASRHRHACLRQAGFASARPARPPPHLGLLSAPPAWPTASAPPWCAGGQRQRRACPGRIAAASPGRTPSSCASAPAGSAAPLAVPATLTLLPSSALRAELTHGERLEYLQHRLTTSLHLHAILDACCTPTPSHHPALPPSPALLPAHQGPLLTSRIRRPVDRGWWRRKATTEAAAAEMGPSRVEQGSGLDFRGQCGPLWTGRVGDVAPMRSRIAGRDGLAKPTTRRERPAASPARRRRGEGAARFLPRLALLGRGRAAARGPAPRRPPIARPAIAGTGASGDTASSGSARKAPSRCRVSSQRR